MFARFLPRALVALVIAGSTGCQQPRDDRDARETVLLGADTRAVGDAPVAMAVSRTPDTQPVKFGEYQVVGELADTDRRELEDSVARQTHDPILRVRVIRPGEVEVQTGVIRGPLNGGGEFFDFEKREGHWMRTNTNVVKGWRS